MTDTITVTVTREDHDSRKRSRYSYTLPVLASRWADAKWRRDWIDWMYADGAVVLRGAE